MSDKITESTLEQFAIDLLEKQGDHYIYSPDIAPDSDTLLPKLMSGEVRVKLSEHDLQDYRMGTIKKNTDEIILEIYKYSDSVQTITGLQDGHD
jgi:hypothetical protein